MSSREAFEKWAEREGLKIDRVVGGESYRRLVAQWSWEAWKAATERAAREGSDAVRKAIREGNE